MRSAEGRRAAALVALARRCRRSSPPPQARPLAAISRSVGTGSIVASEWTPLGSATARHRRRPDRGRPGRRRAGQPQAASSARPRSRPSRPAQAARQDASSLLSPTSAARCSPTTSPRTTASRSRIAAPADRRARQRCPNVVAVHPARSDDARQRARRPADRRAGRLGRPARPARREHQGRRHRHRHRLHARRTSAAPARSRRYTPRDAADTLPPSPGCSAGAPRVKGGIDLVGDDYNADPDSRRIQPVPHPGPEPARLQRARLARRRLRGRLGRARERQHATPGRTTRRRSRATRGRSARASPRRPTCTAIRVFGCAARPTSRSTRSSGRSRTTWT